MSKFKSLLTDDERQYIIQEAALSRVKVGSVAEQISHATEVAVLAKLAAQEPVGWLNPVGGYLSDHYIKNYSTGLEREKHTIPVYAALAQLDALGGGE